MALYDCFMYCDEDLLLDLRLNILNDYVDYFVLVEGKKDHQGKPRSLNFNIKKFDKFKNKIRYIVADNYPKSDYTWDLEHYQRDCVLKGIEDSTKDDIIIISDVDEIPNPEAIKKFSSRNRYGIFVQKNFYYKLNLLDTSDSWNGSKICVKKYLKSPNWLRYKVKIKKYPFYRIDKPKPAQIIENGGWHFSFLKTPGGIAKKLDSYAHKEYNKPEFKDEKIIEEKIKNKKDLFNRKIVLEKVEVDETYPRYILNNKNKYKEWIL